MPNKFSLIICTLGRKIELLKLFESIMELDYNQKDLEIIIVDQNKKGFLDDVIAKFYDLNLIYIHSDIKGLSYNRNIGLRYATGDIICFPDDDCKFYPETLTEVSTILANNIDFCVGRVFDKERNKNIFKNWSNNVFSINRFNFYFVNVSFTLFVKKKYILNFDEHLGVGGRYGSCEDADLIYRLLENKAKGIYSPKIVLWHPEPNFQEISLEKVKNYASGFGYFVRKNTDTIKFLLLVLLIGKKGMQFMMNIVSKKFQKGYFKAFFSGLFMGLNYK